MSYEGTILIVKKWTMRIHMSGYIRIFFSNLNNIYINLTTQKNSFVC